MIDQVLRILIVVEAIPPHCGGGEQVAWIQATTLGAKHDVMVLTFSDTAGTSTMDGIRVCAFEKLRRNLFSYLTYKAAELNRVVDDFDPHIVHVHMPHVLSTAIRKRQRFFVTTIHDGVPENEQLRAGTKTLPAWLRFKLLRRVNIAKSDAVTCVSNHNMQLMRRLYPKYAAKFSMIPNPVYERLFVEDPRPSTAGYVLNFGRQIALKMGPLIEVARRMPEQEFLFVGTGDMVKDYELPNVKFVGFSADVAHYIDGAMLCVFPSQSENMPLVGIESMARGRAVIATRRGFSEYIDHEVTGLLLDTVSPEEIQTKIAALAENPKLRHKIERAGREKVEEFRPDKIARQYESLYQSLLARADRASL